MNLMTMSSWTHSICLDCWETREGHRMPVQINRRMRQISVCCFCDQVHFDGIYYRSEPSIPQCNGEGGPHEQKGDDQD